MDIIHRRPAIRSGIHSRHYAECDGSGLPTDASPPCFPAEITVRRMNGSDLVDVEIEMSCVGRMRIELGPAKLRRLASDLLDAAADIEAYPAAALARVPS